MSNTVIKVENLGKLYKLGEVGTGTISHDLNRWWARVRGKEDPFAKVGETNDRTVKGNSDYVWALKDVNFEVKQGEVLGIIGRNGAGKSTLLKILSKVTTPSTGNIKVKGRIASLLEVGTGFHPELTGRENIYLNGAILGMTKAEIRSKFDEIVDFAGVERYIDTPVKRYSSGMYVRLAFAVAAFLEPEILIVDEVLAVGDAEFQKKCLGRMKDVSVNEGRTVLFVSHNMSAVNKLCTSAILLSKGSINQLGTVPSVINSYYSNKHTTVSLEDEHKRRNIIIEHINFKLNNIITNEVSVGDDVEVELKLKNISSKLFNAIKIGIALENSSSGSFVLINYSHFQNIIFDSIDGEYCIKIPKINIVPGTYLLHLRIVSEEQELYWNTNIAELIIRPGDFFGTGVTGEESLCSHLHILNWNKS
jgi:lipopolysaccharide transport system ATP-binding protein